MRIANGEWRMEGEAPAEPRTPSPSTGRAGVGDRSKAPAKPKSGRMANGKWRVVSGEWQGKSLLARGRLLLLMIALPCALVFADRPVILVAQTRAPLAQANQEPYDPNIDLVPYMLRHLKELRKVEAIAYNPQHPTVQRFASEKKLEPKTLESPDASLLMQIGRMLHATYVLIARCTRQKESEQLEYEVEMWQPGRRVPVWRTKGAQQALSRDSSLDTALNSLARTIALRLDTELWSNLPSLPERQTELSPSGSSATVPPAKQRESEGGSQDKKSEGVNPNKLLSEGRLSEALPLLRAAVNQNPLDATLRLQLVDLYQRLGLKDAALEECERAMRLMPQNERLLQLWARLMREQGRIADAIRTLQQLEGEPPGEPRTGTGRIRTLLLFDLQLLSGDFAGAEATLAKMRSANTPEVRWRVYLMQGIKRQFGKAQEPNRLTREQLPALLFVVNGVMNDLANELLDLRRLASDPTPDWKLLRERGEQIVIRALDFGAWLGQLQPDEQARDAYAHLQFGAHLMGQAAQQMARYLLFRKEEDLENATLLRAEALRELEEANRLGESSE